MDDFLTLHELVRAARANLKDEYWDYLMGGAESETTLLRNRQALDSLAFRPRVLRDMREIDCASSFLGQPMRIPVLLAPLGSLQVFEAGGALSVARAAAAFGVTSFLSSVCLPGLEDVAAGAKHPKVYQLYVRGDRAWVEDHVQRAIEHGYQAFCFTIDTAIYGRRERDLLRRYTPSARRTVTGFDFQAGMSWELVQWFKEKFSMPLVLKGIATAEDAALAVEHGVDVIYVSNHGGRQLDHGAGAIAILPEVIDCVGGRAQVVVDGGFLRGTDVVKAIALGARAVGIGKLCGLALAAGGELGVMRALELLETEIRLCMGLLGVNRLDQLNKSYLRAATPVGRSSALGSAFPFIELVDAAY